VKLRVLDLFSGIGGFSLGLERTGGFETVAFCEIEPYCRRVLAKHWPNIPCNEDINTLAVGRAWQTWLRLASPAKTYHSLDKVPDFPASVPVSGGGFAEPFAWYDHGSRCWRTWQRCFLGEWERFSGAWPRSGMTRNGIAYRLPMLAAPTLETGYGLLPTPTVCGNYNRAGCSPTSGDGYFTRFMALFGRYPTAMETEMMFGFPAQWTRLETPSSQTFQNSLAAPSLKQKDRSACVETQREKPNEKASCTCTHDRNPSSCG